jgi:hypothetical protein
MATYTVSTRITWSEIGVDVDPLFNEARSEKIAEMVMAGKTDGVFHAEEHPEYPFKPSFSRDFIDQAAADEFLTFIKDAVAAIGHPEYIAEALTIPTPTDREKPGTLGLSLTQPNA